MSETELARCPFCGSNASIYRNEKAEYQAQCKANDANWHGTEGVIGEWCHYESEIWFDTEQEAIDEWNHRPLEAELKAEIERLRETNMKLHRRCQQAESANKTTIANCRREGVSLGRSLANAGYSNLEYETGQQQARIEELEKQAEIMEAATKSVYKERDAYKYALGEIADDVCVCNEYSVDCVCARECAKKAIEGNGE